jgi:hypothetical protein
MWVVCKHLPHPVLLSLDMVHVSLYLILLLVGKELDTVLQSSQLRNKIRNSISKEHILSDNFHYFFIFYYLNFFHFIIFTFTHMYIHCLGHLPHTHLLLPLLPSFLEIILPTIKNGLLPCTHMAIQILLTFPNQVKYAISWH